VKDLFLDKQKLRLFFESVDNPFEALAIKSNLEYALGGLNTPSNKLLKIWEEEGFDPSLISLTKAQNSPLKVRKVNIENRSFLIEQDTPIKVLVGRAVKTEKTKGSVVLKYHQLSSEQAEVAKKLVAN
jgi:hypothetical protein